MSKHPLKVYSTRNFGGNRAIPLGISLNLVSLLHIAIRVNGAGSTDVKLNYVRNTARGISHGAVGVIII